MERAAPRPLVVCACAGLLSCLASCTPEADTAHPEGEAAGTEDRAIKVGAIFSVTGPNAFLGAPEAKTVEMLVEKLNASGGILGRKLQLILKDSQGSPQKAVSFAKQLIDEDKVLAILGPSTSEETMQMKSLCEEGKTLLISCAAAETIVEPVAKYVFMTPQKDSYAVERIYRSLKDRGLTKIGVLASNTGFGNAGKEQLAKYAPQYGIQIIDIEVYDKRETDLTGALAKLKAVNVQAVVNWSIEAAQSLVAKDMKRIGLDVPLYQSHGFGNIKYVEAAGEAAEGIVFPSGRLLVADTLPDADPQKAVLLQYKKDYEARFGEAASIFGGHAYDAFLVLTQAIQRAGGAEKAKVRDALESIHGLVGTAGIFDFSPTDHNGLDMNSFAMLTVEHGRFVPYEP